jgi:hypothetical protein
MQVITLRVDLTELAVWRAAAGKRSLSEWIRQRCYVGTPTVPSNTTTIAEESTLPQVIENKARWNKKSAI